MIHNSFRRIALAQGLLPERPFLPESPETGQRSEYQVDHGVDDRGLSGQDGADFWRRAPERIIQV